MDERVGICVFVRKARAEKMRRSVPRLKKGGVWSNIECECVCVSCNRDERCVGKTGTRDNLRTIERER